MAKLKLNLEALSVETFEAAQEPEPSGTIYAQEVSSDGPFGCQYACNSYGECSGMYCQSLSTCESYENTCFCETNETC